MQFITPKEANEKTTKIPNALLIDVRSPKEFEEKHALPAINLPLNEINCKTIRKLSTNKDAPVMILCQNGTRAKTAIKQLDKEYQSKVYCVEGGTVAWEQEGLSLATGKKTLSVERQVRIVAGFLVLIGVLLGLLIHPAYLFLSGFVGCGLIFAGMTDTCGMATILQHMPWNR